MQPLHVVLVVSGALCLAAVAVLVAKRKGKEGGEPGPKRARLSGPLGAFGFTVAEGPADVEAGGGAGAAEPPPPVHTPAESEVQAFPSPQAEVLGGSAAAAAAAATGACT